MKSILSLCAALALSSLAATAALVAHFDFEEGSGDGTASRVGGWTGPFSGDPTWVTAGLAPVPSGTTAALAFDGIDDRIITDYAGIGGSGDRSVSFWISTTNGTQNTAIVAWGNSATPNGRKWHVRLNNSSANGTVTAVRTEIQGSFEIDGPPLADGGWHHVVSAYSAGGVFGSGQVMHYVDGVLVSDGDLQTGADTVLVATLTSPTVTGTTYPVMLGGRHQGSLVSFDGLVDEVRIYDHALSEPEVLELFRGTGGRAAFEITGVTLAADGTAATITWRSQQGKTYRIESSGDLTGMPWEELVDALPSQGETTSFTHLNVPPGTARLYYRVAEE